MSDEFMEGRALRGGHPPADESFGGKGRPAKGEPADMPTSELPFVSLEPPDEAGDVIRQQAEAPTFHRGLEPVMIEGKPSRSSEPPADSAPPAEPAAKLEDSEPTPELPWEVIEEPPREKLDSEPIMKLPKVSVEVESPRKSPGKVPDFVPQLHTPTGELPKVPDIESEAPVPRRRTPPREQPKVPESEPEGFVPQLHTPTGELPKVPDIEIEGEDFVPHLHTPTGELPIAPTEEAEDSTPGVHTPPVEHPPVKRRRTSPRELPKVPDIEAEDFVPHLHTPTGELPSVPTEEEEDFAPGVHTPPVEHPPVKRRRTPPRELPPVPHQRTPPVLEPIPEYGAGYKEEEEDEVADLPRATLAEDEPSGEVVDADWVREPDDPHTALRRKVPGSVQWAERPSFWQRFKLPITFFAVLIGAAAVALGIKAVRDGMIVLPAGSATPEATPPLSDETGTAQPGGIVTIEGQTPAPTGIPPYAEGRIAFASNRDGDFDVYVLELASGTVTQITTDPGSDRSPVWSPDGRQIIFVSDRAGDDDLYLVPAQGGDAVQLTGGASSDRNPAWSPDGQLVVFSRENVDGSRLMAFPASCLSAALACEDQLILLTPGGYDRFPAWSPDGARIAFAAGDFPGLPTVIALINPDGGGYAGLAGTQTSDFGPAWSPDGGRIAFVSLARGDYDIWIMAPNGGIVEQITRNPSSDIEPAWSPDGMWLVFASDRGGSADFDLYVVPSGCNQPETGCDTDPIQLTDNDADDYNPAWHP